ncbi:MAG: SHOCT domain-containing protein [Actinobacteria bacterium]|nr:SHOCT domain-containing protein [Actinomycetota bacterium]
MMGFGGFGGFGMIFGFIWSAAIITGIVFLVIWLVKRFSYATADKTGNRSLDILKERYAKNEITKEQFENMKKDLS